MRAEIPKSGSKSVIRVGDMIRVVIPEVVVRVGYEHDFLWHRKRIAQDHRTAIDVLIREVYPEYPAWAWEDSSRWEDIRQRVAMGLAREASLRDRKYGAKRRIFTEPAQELMGSVGQVIAIRSAKTGRYHPASGNGENWEPAYLEGEKTHRLLTLSTPRGVEMDALCVEKAKGCIDAC